PLCVFGVLAQLGDPAPGFSMVEYAAHQRQMSVMVLVGLVSLMSALWLAGYSYSAARIRAISAKQRTWAVTLNIWIAAGGCCGGSNPCSRNTSFERRREG